MVLATRAPFFVLDFDFLLFSCSECLPHGFLVMREGLSHTSEKAG